MRFILLPFVLLACMSSFSLNAASPKGNVSARLDKVEEEVHRIQIASEQNEVRQQILNERIDNLFELQGKSSDAFSNEISLSNRYITVFSAILALVAAFVVFYVSRVESKVKSMKVAIEDKEKEAKELFDMINNNISGLYERVRREDTVNILKRLVCVPRDIANLEERILCVDLNDSDFDLLKTAYSNLINEGCHDSRCSATLTFGDAYLMVFFQHFLGKSIEESLLRDRIIRFFPNGIAGAFTNDIDKSTRDLARSLANKHAGYNRESVLLEYRKALAKSQYNTRESLLDDLREGINDAVLWDKVSSSLKAGSVA